MFSDDKQGEFPVRYVMSIYQREGITLEDHHQDHYHVNNLLRLGALHIFPVFPETGLYHFIPADEVINFRGAG